METLPKLILAGEKRQNNKKQPSRQLTGQSQQYKNCNKKKNVFKVSNKEARTTSTMSLFLTLSLSVFTYLLLRILVSLLLTLNIFYILHGVKNAEIRALYWNKERKVSLTDCKLKCFS